MNQQIEYNGKVYTLNDIPKSFTRKVKNNILQQYVDHIRRGREYRAKNKERMNKLCREYRKKHKARLIKQCREYYYKNREALLIKSKEYYEANIDIIKEKDRI